MDRLARLRSVPLFAKLDGEALQHLASIASEFDAPAGRVLIERGAPGSGMFVLEEGIVTVEADEGTLELIAGEAFGELALLTDEGRRTARVRAKTDVSCLAIRREDFEAAIRSQPGFGEVLEALEARYGRRA